NIFNVLSQISRYGIISVGMALIIITGGIDLSVGYAVGLCATTAAFLTTVAGLPWIVVLLLVLGLGAVIGLLNGTLVTFVGLPAFIVTLATGKILSGCTMLLTKGRPISFESPLSFLGGGYVGSVPMCVILMFLIIIGGTIFAKYTQPGRNIYAIGNNKRAAALSGIKVKRMTCLVYVIESMLCAFCGIIVAGNLLSADATLGTGYDTDTIAAVVIGGVSMTGGEGSIGGALIGAAIMGVLKNAFVLLSVSSYWQSIAIGIVIIFAVTIDRVRSNRKKI
ncbi:MAG: ABC transporter permease, partial [Lachnospiraceae bacterium]|nr:ABC transporter permease [Lachnospiraceae bacterium]